MLNSFQFLHYLIVSKKKLILRMIFISAHPEMVETRRGEYPFLLLFLCVFFSIKYHPDNMHSYFLFSGMICLLHPFDTLLMKMWYSRMSTSDCLIALYFVIWQSHLIMKRQRPLCQLPGILLIASSHIPIPGSLPPKVKSIIEFIKWKAFSNKIITVFHMKLFVQHPSHTPSDT